MIFNFYFAGTWIDPCAIVCRSWGEKPASQSNNCWCRITYKGVGSNSKDVQAGSQWTSRFYCTMGIICANSTSTESWYSQQSESMNIKYRLGLLGCDSRWFVAYIPSLGTNFCFRVYPKCLYLSTEIPSITSQKTIHFILTSIRISNHMQCLLWGSLNFDSPPPPPFCTASHLISCIAVHASTRHGTVSHHAVLHFTTLHCTAVYVFAPHCCISLLMSGNCSAPHRTALLHRWDSILVSSEDYCTEYKVWYCVSGCLRFGIKNNSSNKHTAEKLFPAAHYWVKPWRPACGSQGQP